MLCAGRVSSVAVTANNHCCDGGARGIGATLAALNDDAGLRHTGTFVDSLRHGADHPLRLAANGIRFALFNYTYGTNGLPVPAGTTVNRIDTTVIARDLAAVDRGAVDLRYRLRALGQRVRTSA